MATGTTVKEDHLINSSRHTLHISNVRSANLSFLHGVIVKTASFEELAPYDPDWHYVRADVVGAGGTEVNRPIFVRVVALFSVTYFNNCRMRALLILIERVDEGLHQMDSEILTKLLAGKLLFYDP